jgi:electron transfer flavoprotein alpha subunit
MAVNERVQSKIWVFAEQRQGQLTEVGLELLGKALELAHPAGWKVASVLVGHSLSELGKRLLSFGADEVLVVDHPLLSSYCSQSHAKVLENSIRQHNPEVFLLGATAMGSDLGARLAARLRTGLSAHCIGLELSPEKKLFALVPGWGGNVLAKVYSPFTQPQMATVMPGVFDLPKEGAVVGQIIPLDADVRPEDVTYKVLEIRKEAEQEDQLEKAGVVIAGGSGIGSKADWEWVEGLASALKGAVGATRPPVDEGWAREDQMIGQSGRTVHPKLYVGVGISGQMHHMVGIKGAELIVAINQDPQAPIFEHCDLGLVGDFKEIIPHLIRAIEAYSNSKQKDHSNLHFDSTDSG